MAEFPRPVTSGVGAVLIPMNVDAFVLNEKVCDTGLARIAPITQPDYLGLRPNNAEIQHDVLPHVNLDRTQPATVNSRISAVETLNLAPLDPTKPGSDVLSTPPVRNNRIGVYLHWSLPRCYRAATGAAEGTEKLDTHENQSANPAFRLVPNRWVVYRVIKSSEPDLGAAQMPKTRMWVIDSDRLWNVDDLDLGIDLQTDVSPYVAYQPGDEASPDCLNRQAGVFIGSKQPRSAWNETTSRSHPRVPLTTMNSSNFSFADNAVHNPNVFSMVDNFEYLDKYNKTAYLDKVTCNYTVIGWHDLETEDPLGSAGLKGTLHDRLNALMCDYIPDPAHLDWYQTVSPTRTLCQGSILDVQYDRATKPSTPADKYAALFTAAVRMEPVSVGTTALDSVLTFMQAHDSDADSIFGSGSTSVARDLHSLSELLYATEDDYNSRIKASDIIYAHNFAPSSGGNAWHYDGKANPGGAPALPATISATGTGPSEADYLEKVNDLQLQLDAANRKLQLIRWSVFATWWKFVSDPENAESATRAVYKTEVAKLRSEAQELIKFISDPDRGLEIAIERIVRKRRDGGPFFFPEVPARSVVQPSFYQRKDPTICLAGIDSGWPHEYVGRTLVQVTSPDINKWWAPLAQGGGPPSAPDPDPDPSRWFMDEEVADEKAAQALRTLLGEAWSPSGPTRTIGTKVWTGQPWCPLYIEWEAIYFHIPFEKWSVDVLSSPIGSNHGQLRYTVKEALPDDPQSTSDQRIVGGRCIILPQPAVNLHALVGQIVDTAGVELPRDLTHPTQQAALLAKIARLKFISTELTGLTNNLLTLANGSHVQPNLSIPGQNDSLPLAAAVAAGLDAGLSQNDLILSGGESALTPYGTLVDFSNRPKPPFKGVTHGQLRFTKLNIIDKFGQVISAIDPKPAKRSMAGLPDTIYPCLGDQVSPGLIPNSNHLNTVTALTDPDPQLPGSSPLCPYVQLTPAINQNARLNAAFLQPTMDSHGVFRGWQATTDWQQPIWAWVVINYADYGLQFFTSDGTFYVEMTLGGPFSTLTSAKWLPFDPPTQASASHVSPQLVQLIKQMTGGAAGATYFRSFWDMITKAVENMPFAPPDYAAYASSIVGKPLALVNAGFSLELATPPLQSQTRLPPLHSSTPAATTEADELFAYKFPIKIGDADRPYDGVVGYFDSQNSAGTGGGGSTDWSSLHTYFVSKTSSGVPQAGDPRREIKPDNFPTLSPYYVHPDGQLVDGSFAASHAAHFMVKTLLVDPYTPLHVYSPILPITSLQLPAWTVQSSLQKMSAFFKLGPCLITHDVPPTYDPTHPLSADSWLQHQQNLNLPSSSTTDTAPIRLPLTGSKKGLWNWLQPYDIGETTATTESGGRKYNALEVGIDDGRLRLDPAPYTLVEGFLQLVRPLIRDDVVNLGSTSGGGSGGP